MKITAIAVLLIAYAYPVNVNATPPDWVNTTLRCDGYDSNLCYQYAHPRAELDAIEQRRRQILRQYAQREHARRLAHQYEHREERREERREVEYRDDRRDHHQIVRYVERGGRTTDIRPERKHECLPYKVRRVGTEHMIEANSRTAAENAWSEEVRYTSGERFMDVQHARDVRLTCSRSSTPEGVINRIEAAVGAHKVRCEIEARPCLPQPSQDK